MLISLVVYLTLKAETCFFFNHVLWCNLVISFIIFMCKNWEQTNHGINVTFAGTDFIINLWILCSVADIILRLWCYDVAHWFVDMIASLHISVFGIMLCCNTLLKIYFAWMQILIDDYHGITAVLHMPLHEVWEFSYFFLLSFYPDEVYTSPSRAKGRGNQRSEAKG